MFSTRTWYAVHLTDGTEQHAYASHIGFNPTGPVGAEVVFYANEQGTRVDMTLPVKAIERIEARDPDN